MKLASKLTILITTLITFCIFNNVHAESFQSPQSVSFTLNPTISITVSGDLSIESLTPGDYKDSNIITVTAASNAIAGYTVGSTVGASTNPSTELRLGGTDMTNKFTSITSNKASLSDFDDNTSTWGYSYSTDSGSTWQSRDITGTINTGYNGLPIYTTDSPITLINSTTSGSNSVQFKIGARAATTQIAGEYTNVINFIGVANPNPPIVYMQSATLADCGKDMVDIRDNNVYTTTLIEDTCWMTKNLDLPGSTILSSDDTDFTSDYYANLPNTNGWIVVDNNKLKMPSSSTEGFSENNYAYVYNSGNISSNCAAPGCYSYYSWDAATLGSGRSITTGNTDAPYSICPKGWRLPNTRTGTDDTSDFRKLMIALGGSSEISIYNADTIPTGTTVFNSLTSTPLNFLNIGVYNNGLFSGGNSAGHYWSATTYSDIYTLFLYFYSTNSGVYSANPATRQFGLAIRCVKSF